MRPEVVRRHPGDLVQTLPEQPPQVERAFGDRRQAESQGLVDSRPEAQHVDVTVLPGREALGAAVPVEAAVVSVPGGGGHLGHVRLESLDGPRPGPQEAGPAGSAQELATGPGQQVATQLGHIDRQLPDHLGRVEQVEDVGGPGDPADLRRRVDQPAAGGDPGQPDHPGALIDQVSERLHVDLTGSVVRDDHQLGARPRGHLPVRQHAAAVLVDPGQDPVSRAQRHRVERRVPGVGRVVEQRDLVLGPADQRGKTASRAGDPVRHGRLRLVPPDLRLQLQLGPHHVQGGRGHQAGTGVVQVGAVRAPGGLLPQLLHVHDASLPATAPHGRASNWPTRVWCQNRSVRAGVQPRSRVATS